MARQAPNLVPRRRLRPIHRRMSWTAFQRLPRRLGWKHEYYDGQAHLTPASLVVPFVLDLAPRRVPRRAGIRRVTPADAPALQAPFLAAFALTPEYACYPSSRFARSGAEYLDRFFGNVRGEWSPVSVVVEDAGRLIGAALVKQRQNGPLLDCLFVRPEHGRQGLATAMVARVVRGLLRRGETRLLSYVILANEPSMAWHQRFGFQEIPSARVACHRWWVYRDELERHRQLGDLTGPELEELERQEAAWAAEAQRLDELERHDYRAANPRFD
jgi:L-amino acid N-acyltransferase YncA